MDIRWLQDFLAVAETGNFTRAAERRNLSQAAFSRRIQALESWLGVALIDRSVFPTRLTEEGEQFRQHAGDILQQVIDARHAVAGASVPGREHIRLALPFVLATTRLPHWWTGWLSAQPLSATVELGNIHDLITALTAGNADIMICYLSDQQPIALDPDRYDRTVIETDTLRPYASPALLERGVFLPGTADRPVPLLMYSAGVYFARLVDLVIETASEKVAGSRIMESDMSDVLRDMALAGHGVAWLPDSTAAAGAGRLVPLKGDAWTLPLKVVAFKDRANRRRSVARLWSLLAGEEERADGDHETDSAFFVNPSLLGEA
ncbi:MAG: LysR family transcriptional regulator [Rhodospirillaceae bacterium]|nr:LysR family transcriptional regulator [Rhodospirillaceae bacterium]